MGDRVLVRGLTLVYNADSDKLSALVDGARKLLRLKGCTLCSITHGVLGEKPEWRSCKEELGVPVRALHRDELAQPLREAVGDQLPCVLADTDAGPRIVLGPQVLERCRGSVADFRGRLKTHAAMKSLALPT
ncbi:MAG: hypothetical protein D6696_12805 [Acidobacteria bacterium]|nr:MAG: hypothetical protein D6696_12805 [Acidobacteriota bacterium]